ncbi:MAG: 1-acyl-sn-glycerol-3-phosphate acyltransferase [Clostridiales bacterium]|nr:1-acyl-sn-glycerol-3-phosphate acyltransferase [Clostridiales bacterium]
MSLDTGLKKNRRRRSALLMDTLGDVYAFIYCMMISSALTDMPLLGGALYMCGRVTMVFISTFSNPFVPVMARKLRGVLLGVMLLMSLCVVVVYPISMSNPAVWLVVTVVLAMILRDIVWKRLLDKEAKGAIPRKEMLLWTVVFTLGTACVVSLILMYNLPVTAALPMAGGYILCTMMAYSSLREQRGQADDRLDAPEITQLADLRKNVRAANAYRTYERLSTLVNIAMEMTLVVMYTYLAVTADAIFICMVLAVLTTFAARLLAEKWLHRREKRRATDPTYLMLAGLLIWLFALWVFYRSLQGGQFGQTYAYVCLGLSTVASTLCTTCLKRMEAAVSDAVRFASAESAPAYGQMRRAEQELATLLGQMLALAGLTAMCLVTGKNLPRDGAQLAAAFQPVMLLPALATVVLALMSVFRFPLSSRYIHKLDWFLSIRESGGNNPSLEKMLEDVVVEKHRQPFAIRAMMALLRPFFRHTIKGGEHIVQDENNPIVFLCNHGEIYGPVSSMLYIPVPVRPWVISELTTKPEDVSRYIYKWTFEPMKWLGKASWWISKLIGPISVWGMKQLEVIPVFRNKPRELMVTFRRSVEAMEAGDNLLIFPENPDASDTPGYADGGMGEMFRGFPMLAQVYYNRTGKRCRFLPMYAHKGMRTLSFSEPIHYDPENDPMAERDRIVEAATAQMKALYEREEALYQEKLAKKNRKKKKTSGEISA